MSESVMQMASYALRGLMIAPPGRKLVVADLSNIEGRGLAWEAGEEWKLQAFRDFDAGTGPDLYKLAYARAFRIKPEAVTKAQRQVGKVMELSLGYEGGVGAFVTMAASYGIDLDALATLAWDTIPLDVKLETQGAWEWAEKKRATFGLTSIQYRTCDGLKRLWRRAHPATVQMWKDLKTATQLATMGEEPAPVGRCRIERRNNWLCIVLPSDRVLCYPSPLIENGALTYMGMNQYSRKWSRLGTYGGKLSENLTQAIARDVLADAMPRAEAAGYHISLTVHDELITETPDTPEFSAEGLCSILAANPPWATGFPLAAQGFEAYRYNK